MRYVSRTLMHTVEFAWRTFFERLAATAPVVMVFEDFHNADSGLIDFVDELLKWSRALPILTFMPSQPVGRSVRRICFSTC